FTTERIRRGVFTSVPALERRLRRHRTQQSRSGAFRLDNIRKRHHPQGQSRQSGAENAPLAHRG
ncbi:MAG: hypothetical protein ACREUY_02135, partial [Burkholderiales bacterium]